MRVKTSSIIAVISIVLYAAAIGSGIIRIVAGINERRGIAQREFYDLTDIASSAGVLGFMEEPFKEAVRDAVRSSKTIQGVIITGPFEAEFTYEREDNGIIVWEGNIPRFQRRFGNTPDPHFSNLRVEGQRNATIQAVSSDIDYPAFALILTQSLLMVFVSVLLSTVTFLIYSRRDKKPLVSDKIQKTYSSHPAETVLKADRSNAGEESLTKEKLDRELRRCSAADQDLSLIFVDLSLTAGFGVGDDPGVYRKFTDQALQFFIGRDLIFERGDRGISIVLPDTTLEESFNKAKQFHNQMISTLPEIFLHTNDLRIGISARTGRLLRADRLLLEASKALERANLELESPIVAFKSDPEKYRTFMKRQGNKSGDV